MQRGQNAARCGDRRQHVRHPGQYSDHIRGEGRRIGAPQRQQRRPQYEPVVVGTALPLPAVLGDRDPQMRVQPAVALQPLLAPVPLLPPHRRGGAPGGGARGVEPRGVVGGELALPDQHRSGIEGRTLQRVQQRQHPRQVIRALLGERHDGVADVHRPDRVCQRLVEEPAAQHPALRLTVLRGGQLLVQSGVLDESGHRLITLSAVGEHPQVARPGLVRQHQPGAAHRLVVHPAAVRTARTALREHPGEHITVVQLHPVRGADVRVPPAAALPRDPPQRGHTPPSMSTVVAVRKPDAGDARWTTAEATSSGVPARPTGMPASIASCAAGAVNVSWKAVPLMKPGATVFTVIPLPPSSLARPLVKPRMPALAAA